MRYIAVLLCFLMSCRFEPIKPLYRLTIANGEGSGLYSSDEVANIRASGLSGLRFVVWEGDVQFVQETNQAQTSVRMPARDVDLRAYLLHKDTLSFQYEVFPLLRQHCNFDGCHVNSGKQANFTDHTAVASVYSKIESYLLSGFMPLNRTISDTDRQKILLWIKQGRKNN